MFILNATNNFADLLSNEQVTLPQDVLAVSKKCRYNTLTNDVKAQYNHTLHANIICSAGKNIWCSKECRL